MSKTIFLEAGRALSIVTDAAFTGHYQLLPNPGAANNACVSLSASATTVLGAYNSAKQILITNITGTFTTSDAFDGYSANDNSPTLTSPTITGGTITNTAITATNAALTTPTITNPSVTLTNNGTKNGGSVSLVSSSSGVHKTILTLTATPITLTADTLRLYGGVLVYTFPLTAIQVLNTKIKGSLTVSGTVLATFTSNVALGTVTAAALATLTTTTADIQVSKACATAVSKVALCNNLAGQSTAFDGTGAAKECYLNFVIGADAANDTTSGTFTGTITINWIDLGDYT